MATIERAIPVGGAVLNFSVVGGTVQPENPKENTIWVDTDTAIGAWMFSAVEPAARADGSALVVGDVWLKVSLTSPTAFNALKKNSIVLCPVACYQWSGNVWTQKDVRVFTAGEWGSVYTYLFDYGETGVAGSLSRLDSNGGSFSVGETIVINLTNNIYYYVRFANSVNFSGYKTMRAKCRVVKAGSANAVISANKDSLWSVASAVNITGKAVGSEFEISLDVSSFNSTTVPWVGMTGISNSNATASVEFMRIWLEY